MLQKYLAANDIVGPVKPPPGIDRWINAGSGAVPGLIPFVNALIKLLIVVAGLYALLNLIFAGYQFMSAGGDPKNIEKAWAKIWQSLVGLAIIAGAFVLIALISWILFGDPREILAPLITGPQ